jgi:hypothetical protein
MRVQVARLHRDAVGDLRGAVEVLENTAANEALKLPCLAFARDEFNPPITSKAGGADDVGFYHTRIMRLLRTTRD